MSLASRLGLLIVLALTGLGAATVAVIRTRRESDAAREATGFTHGETVAHELAAKRDGLPSGVVAAMARGQPPPSELRIFMTTLLAPLFDASVG